MIQPVLKFELAWLSETAASLLRLRVLVDDKNVWPVSGTIDSDLDVFADDVLSFLSENWHIILLEQTYPVYNPPLPSRLRYLAEAAWGENDDIDSESEDIGIEAFEHSHNFSTCFGGVYELPPLWFMRQGKVIVVDNGDEAWRIGFDQARDALRDLGDSIAARLSTEPRFSSLVAAWNERCEMDSLTLLATVIGVPHERAESLVEANVLDLPGGFDELLHDRDELRIAARVTGTLDFEEMRAILLRAKSVPHRHSSAFLAVKQRVTQEMLKAPESAYRRPHDVGVDMAILVREELGYAAAQRVEPEEILERLGVSLFIADDLSPNFMGLAIWGATYGPGIIVARGRFNSGRASFQRVTICHELAHLLMDDDEAVGAVDVVRAIDVLRGRVPQAVEQRAKSFAGEFLLPTKTAADVWERKGRTSDIHGIADVLESLQRTYGVTRSVAAWKLEHGFRFLGCDFSEILDELAPQR